MQGCNTSLKPRQDRRGGDSATHTLNAGRARPTDNPPTLTLTNHTETQQAQRRDPLAQRSSAPVEIPRACAISSAVARCNATDSFCEEKESHVRAAHVVSSYSALLSRFWRSSARSRIRCTTSGEKPPKLSKRSTYADVDAVHADRPVVVARHRRHVALAGHPVMARNVPSLGLPVAALT